MTANVPLAQRRRGELNGWPGYLERRILRVVEGLPDRVIVHLEAFERAHHFRTCGWIGPAQVQSAIERCDPTTRHLRPVSSPPPPRR